MAGADPEKRVTNIEIVVDNGFVELFMGKGGDCGDLYVENSVRGVSVSPLGHPLDARMIKYAEYKQFKNFYCFRKNSVFIKILIILFTYYWSPNNCTSFYSFNLSSIALLRSQWLH